MNCYKIKTEIFILRFCQTFIIILTHLLLYFNTLLYIAIEQLSLFLRIPEKWTFSFSRICFFYFPFIHCLWRGTLSIAATNNSSIIILYVFLYCHPLLSSLSHHVCCCHCWFMRQLWGRRISLLSPITPKT